MCEGEGDMPIDDLVYGWHEMQEALPGYQEAEDYYRGEVDEVFPSREIAEAIGSTGQAYKFGLAAIPVKTLVNRVELAGVRSEESAIERAISSITKANMLAVRWPDLILATAEYGDAYLQVWDVAEDDPNRKLARAGVGIELQKPKHVRMFYDEESELYKQFLLKRWVIRQGTDKLWRVDLYYPDRCEQWISKAGQGPGDESSWERYLDEMSGGEWEIPTPLGEIPFFHFRTGLPYGTPVHKPAFGCQNAVSKMLITQLTTTDSHGWPQRYQLLAVGAELDHAGDDPDWSDDADSEDDSALQGGVSSGQRSGPGTIQTFAGTEEVGQFSAADPKVFLDPAALYVRLMAQLTDTPLHYFDPSGGTPSGESLKVADAPLVRSAERFKTILTDPTEETWDYVLRLAGIADPPPVRVRWKPSHSASTTSDWETVRIKQDSGVPVPVTLKEAGYEPEEVDSWKLPDHPVDAMVAVTESGMDGGVSGRGMPGNGLPPTPTGNIPTSGNA
jgi:hypothetical protein